MDDLEGWSSQPVSLVCRYWTVSLLALRKIQGELVFSLTFFSSTHELRAQPASISRKQASGVDKYWMTQHLFSSFPSLVNPSPSSSFLKPNHDLEKLWAGVVPIRILCSLRTFDTFVRLKFRGLVFSMDVTVSTITFITFALSSMKTIYESISGIREGPKIVGWAAQSLRHALDLLQSIQDESDRAYQKTLRRLCKYSVKG